MKEEFKSEDPDMKKPVGLLLPLFCFLLAVLLTAPLWVLPVVGAILPRNSHENDFTAAIVDKYDRLNAIEGKKIVFVGGSSLPFGLKCDLIEGELPDYTAVDFGLYAALGTVVMMDLSLSGISEGDLVILAPETDPQLYSDFFTPRLFRTAIGDRTDLLDDLSSGRRREAANAYYPVLYDRIRQRNDPLVPESELYARSSFDEYGDIAFVRSRNRMSEGFDSSKTVSLSGLLDGGFVDEVNAYAKKVREKGATLLFWFSPINQAAVRFSDKEANRFMTRLADQLDCEILGDVRDTVYDLGYFYDTNYHLNDDGAILHTANAVKKIKAYLGLEETVAFDVPDPPSDEPEGDEILTDGVFLFEGPTWGTYAIVDVTNESRNSFTAVTVPESFDGYPVTDLRSGCFSGCWRMTSLIIPATVETIGSDVFRGCGKLTEVYIYEENASMLTVPETGLFDGASPNLTVYVPQNAINAYRSSYSWMNYADIIAAFETEQNSPQKQTVDVKPILLMIALSAVLTLLVFFTVFSGILLAAEAHQTKDSADNSAKKGEKKNETT